MKKYCLVVVLLALPIQVMAQAILILGDSISAAYGMPRESGWVALLEKRLGKEYPGQFQVVNASVSGETTAGALYRLPSLLEENPPKLIVIELGGNDGLRGLSPKDMEHNLQTMIRLGQEKDAAIILISVDLPPSYGLHFRQKFAAVFTRLAELPKVDHMVLSFDLLKDRNLLQEDGIHPTAEAQPLLLDAVWSILSTSVHVPER